MALSINTYSPEYRFGRRTDSTVPQIFTEKLTNSLNRDLKNDIFEARRSVKPLQEVERKIDALDVAQKVLYAGGIIPTVRRFGSAPDAIREENWERVLLQLGLGLSHAPRDLEEVKLAFQETKNIFKTRAFPAYRGQHKMTFGGLLEPFTSKIPFFRALDKTLWDIPPIQSVCNIFKFESVENVLHKNLTGLKFTSGPIRNFIGRSLMRTSILGMLPMTIIELPALFKSITKTEGSPGDKGKAFGKQLVKSSAYVALATAGVSMGGAALAPFGKVAALAGMAIGSAVGLVASKAVNKDVDDIFSKGDNSFSVSVGFIS